MSKKKLHSLLAELEYRLVMADQKLRDATRIVSSVRSFIALNDPEERLEPNKYRGETGLPGRDLVFGGYPLNSQKARKRLARKAGR